MINMTIQQFIETAIEGGWKDIRVKINTTPEERNAYLGVEEIMQAIVDRRYFPLIALDPEAWKAVDKILKFEKSWLDPSECVVCEYPGYQDAVEAKMYAMIKHLLKGGTLEEYIATL